MNVASEPLSGHGLGCQGKGQPLSEVGRNHETLQSKNDGVTLTKQRHPSRPLRMSLSSGHTPSSAVTLCLSRVPHHYKYCKSLSTAVPLCQLLHSSAFSAHLPHLSPLCLWSNATCGFLILSTVHLGTPKCWVVVLNAFLKSRPDSSVRPKLSFLLDHSDPLSSNLLPSIKAKQGRWSPLHGITLCCSVQRYAQLGSTSP